MIVELTFFASWLALARLRFVAWRKRNSDAVLFPNEEIK